ncbi:MAG: TIGR02300 family protein [Hyphomicrobiales bacterium]
MVKPELGTKRVCPSCSEKFYDLLKEPIECPLCEYTFVAEPLLPSKNDAPKPKEEPKAKIEETEEDDEDDAVEIVALEDVDEGDDDDDADDPDVAAVADIEDVDVDDDDESEADSDKFLETDDDEGDDVTGIIGGVKPGGGEE